MRHVHLALLLGALAGAWVVASCALDENGTLSDSGGGGPDVIVADVGAPDTLDASYDVPDLGVGETEAGLPCTCVSTLPTGYTLVEYVPDQRPSCTAGYDGSTDYVENPTAPAGTCTCTCSPGFATTPQCKCGSDPVTFPLASGNSTSCTDVPDAGTLLADLGAGCYTTTQNLANTSTTQHTLNYLLVKAPASPCAASGGSCGAGVADASFPPYTVEQGRACDVLGTPGQSSCPSTEVCIPTSGTPYAMCITSFTVDSCQGDPDFPVPHTVGLTVLDNRFCGTSCTCGVTSAGSCGTPQLDLWNNSNSCNGAPDETLPADDTTCTNVGFDNSATIHSTQYTVAQTGGTCGQTGSFGPQGGIVVSSRFTICCRP